MSTFLIEVEKLQVRVYEVNLDGREVDFFSSIDQDNDITVDIAEEEIISWVTSNYSKEEVSEWFGE